MMNLDQKSLCEYMREYWSKWYNRSIGPDVGIASPTNLCSGLKDGGIDTFIEAIINTDHTDMEQEVVLPGGCDRKEYFDRNKSVFVDHQYDTLHCVGKCRTIETNLGLSGSSIKAMTRMLRLDHPLIAAVKALAATPEGCGVSVGYEVIERGKPNADEKARYPKAKTIVRRWKMLEYSFTAMPMNGSCQTLGEWTVDETRSAMRREVLVKGGFGQSVLDAFRLRTEEKPKRRILVWDAEVA